MEQDFLESNSVSKSSSSSVPLKERLEDQLRAKTALRLNYEAQVEVIRRQIGGLEGTRLKLGLSQRKMTQLLLVDPSAWTRWVREGEKAPPHIFRALQWYLALHEKLPGLTPEYFIGPRSSELRLGLEKSRQAQGDLESRLLILEERFGRVRRQNQILALLSLGLGTGFLILILKLFVFV